MQVSVKKSKKSSPGLNGLMTFSCLKFKKLCLCSKDPSEYGILDLLPSGGFFVSGLPMFALHGITSDSAGNNQLIDKESTGIFSSNLVPIAVYSLHFTRVCFAFL
jgi:hypothetical protein